MRQVTSFLLKMLSVYTTLLMLAEVAHWQPVLRG